MGQQIEEGKSPQFPLYIYQCSKDTITGPIEETDELYAEYCGKGTKVRYLRYLEHHAGTLVAGIFRTWSWITARFHKSDIEKCSVEDIAPKDNAMHDMDDYDLEMEKMEGSGVLSDQSGLKNLSFVLGQSFVPSVNGREDIEIDVSQLRRSLWWFFLVLEQRNLSIY